MPAPTAANPGIEQLYRRHAPVVFRRALRLLGTDADAHEVVQDVFLALFEKPNEFRGQSALTTYLYSVTTHACLNRIRQQKNRSRLLREHVDGGGGQGWQTDLSPDQRYHLHRLLERMPEQLARVVVYVSVDELEHEEVAQLLGCSRRQVGKLLARAAAWTRCEEERAC